jgi:deoxycytidine triphosphate deaminase
MKHVLSPNSKTTLTNVQDGDSQPNAVDLRVGKIFHIKPDIFVLSEEEKQHRGSVEVTPNLTDGYFHLYAGNSYEVIMENIINVGEGEAGWVITRSTLNRNGVFLTSGLYDSGYHGAMAAVMHVTSGAFKLKPGTRIGQYLSFNAESLSMYNGSYGLNSQHDKKYGVG